MAYFRKLPGIDEAGFDADRYLQVVPVNHTSRVYLVAGADMDISTDDENIAKVAFDLDDNKRLHRNRSLNDWEKAQSLREVKIKGVAPGKTQLHARLNGADWSNPLNVVVVNDADSRRVGKDSATVSPDIRQAIAGVSLREAVLMVAEDQMNSAISRTSGFGRYCEKEYDWCGAFAYWCWKQAAAIKNATNPFGDGRDCLLSAQKAVSWAMQETTPGYLLRYSGYDPFRGGKNRQEYHEIGWNGYYPEPADIVVVRAGNASGWKHVCMVHTYGDNLVTIDGNQGLPRSIKLRNRDLNQKLSDGAYAHIFIHVLV
jgi:hypothetical protein